MAGDKRRAREQLAADGVPCPGFEWRRFEDPERSGTPGFGFPAVVKPLSLSASRGVIRADGPAEMMEAVSRLESIVAGESGSSIEEGLQVESFVCGPEVEIEGLLGPGVL